MAFKFNPTTGKLDLVDIYENAISITFANINTAIANSTLIPGQWYLITDHQNKTIVAGTEYDESPTITTGPVEEIYVQADSTSTIRIDGYSKTYPDEKIKIKTDGTPILDTDTFEYSTGDETYLSITDTDEITFVDDLIGEDFTNFYFYYENYDDGSYITFDEEGYGTKWTYDSATKKFTNLYGVFKYLYTEYYDGEPSSLDVTITGEKTFTCATDEIDNMVSGQIYFYDNDNEVGGEVFAEDRGVTWDYDTSTHTFTLLSGAEFYDDIDFTGDVYIEFSFEQLAPSDFSDSADVYLEGEVSHIAVSFPLKIICREIPLQKFKIDGDYRSQLVRRYKVLCDTWSAGTYTKGSIVRYNNYIWIALNDTSGTPASDRLNEWFIVMSDSYFLHDSISFTGAVSFGLSKDTSSYYDYPILNTSYLSSFKNSTITNVGSLDELNFYFNGYQLYDSNISVDKVSSSNIARTNGYLKESYFGNITDSNLTSVNRCFFRNGVYYSSAVSLSNDIINGNLQNNVISSLANTLAKGSVTNSQIYTGNYNIFYENQTTNTMISTVNNIFYNSVDNCYFQNFYYNTCSYSMLRDRFYSTTYWNNFLGQVSDLVVFGRMYGSNNTTARSTYGYIQGVICLGSMALNYFSSGFQFSQNIFMLGINNMFSYSSPCYSSARFTDNVCSTRISYWSGTAYFNFKENICNNDVSYLQFNNTGKEATISGNMINGAIGGSGGNAIVFNNTAEHCYVRNNVFNNDIKAWTVTRGIIEFNTFDSSSGCVWGGSNTFTFSYNKVGGAFDNNTMNASMSYNTIPYSYTSKSLTSANAFNNLFLTNSFGSKYSLYASSFTLQEGIYHSSVNANSGSVTVTLLPAVKTFRIIVISKDDSSANTVTINASGSDTINGAGSVVLSSQYESVTLQDTNNGTWFIIGRT